MSRFHIAITVALAITGAGAAVGYFIERWSELLWPSFYLGYWVTLLAIIVACLLGILLAIRSFTGTAASLWQRQWLGVVNGILSVGSWVALMVPM
jgi:hypothetical protein